MLIGVTIIGKDVYPFSHYPMFAMPHRLSRVKVYRIALEDYNGQIQWWKHEAYRYPEVFGKKLAEYYKEAETQNPKTAMLYLMQKQRLLLELVRLIELQGNSGRYKTLHIVERAISNTLQITEHTVEIVPFSKLTHGRVY